MKRVQQRYLHQFLCAMMSYLLICNPIWADENIQRYHKKALSTTLKLIGERQSIANDKLQLLTDTIIARQQMQVDKIDKDITDLKEGNISLDDYKQSLVEENLIQSSKQKLEIKSYLANMDEYELDIIQAQLKDNLNYQDEYMAYTYAFTRTEKLKALEEAIYSDFDRLSTMSIKRIRSMNKDMALRNLKSTKDKIDSSATKGRLFTKKEIIRALQIAGAVMLVIGVITWSRHYGDYEDARDQRNEQLNALRTKLQGELDQLDSELSAAELEYLNNNGYTYMQCGAYQRPDSIICSNYNYSTISGTKYCTVHCYKNLQTGQETLHAPAVCTTPFIPSDCDDPLEYSRGYSAGKPYGLWDGEADGRDDGWDDGQDDAEDDGYYDGYWNAYDDGYDDGWSDGYWSYKNLRAHNESDASNKRFQQGYEQGLKDAQVFNRALGL